MAQPSYPKYIPQSNRTSTPYEDNIYKTNEWENNIFKMATVKTKFKTITYKKFLTQINKTGKMISLTKIKKKQTKIGSKMLI